jgi:hypothetical protein
MKEILFARTGTMHLTGRLVAIAPAERCSNSSGLFDLTRFALRRGLFNGVDFPFRPMVMRELARQVLLFSAVL